MKDEEDIERLVRRYRPSAPPAALRARVVPAVSRRRPLLFAWAPSVAATLLIIMFQLLASGARSRVAAEIGAQRAHERTVNDLTLRLGGDPLARAEAEALVAADEARVDE